MIKAWVEKSCYGSGFPAALLWEVTGDKLLSSAEPVWCASIYQSVLTTDVFLIQVCFLFTSQTFCITVFIADSVLSISLSDMTPGSFCLLWHINWCGFLCSNSSSVLTCVSVIFIKFCQDQTGRILITVFVLELSVCEPLHMNSISWWLEVLVFSEKEGFI